MLTTAHTCPFWLRPLGKERASGAAFEGCPIQSLGKQFCRNLVDRLYTNDSSELVEPLFNDRFHTMYPPNYKEGTHLITGKGPTLF